MLIEEFGVHSRPSAHLRITLTQLEVELVELIGANTAAMG